MSGGGVLRKGGMDRGRGSGAFRSIKDIDYNGVSK